MRCKMSRIKGDKRMIKYVLIFCLLLSGCTFYKQITGDVECPPDEYCLTLTERMKAMNSLTPIRGYRVKGCFHSKQKAYALSKQVNSHAISKAKADETEEIMHCIYCDRKKTSFIEANYYYAKDEWVYDEKKPISSLPSDHFRTTEQMSDPNAPGLCD